MLRVRVFAFVVVASSALALLPSAAASSKRSAPASAHATSLVFVTEPQNTVVGENITGAPLDPSGAPITVEAVDSSGHIVPGFNDPVTIIIDPNGTGARLGGTTTVKAVNGVASFGNLTIDKAGANYILRASNPRLSPGFSSPFDVATTASDCPQGQSCQTNITTSVSDFQVTALPQSGTTNNGTLTESVDVGTALQCPGYTEQDPNWFEFFSTSTSRRKVITYTIKNTTPAAVEFCLGAPYDFTTNAGTPAPPATLPDGSSGFVGLLPDCSAGGPCIDSRTSTPDSSSTTGIDTIIKVQIPAGLSGDPWGRS